MAGVIVSNWRVEGQRFRHIVTVMAAPGASSEVHLPTRSLDSITEGGKPLAQSNGARLLRFEKNRAVLALESGTYNFLVLSQSSA